MALTFLHPTRSEGGRLAACPAVTAPTVADPGTTARR